MNLALTEAQEILRRNAREFLAEASPPSLVKAMMADPQGYSPQLWQGMIDQGWTGLIIPEEYGGSSGTVLDAVVLFEEIGRTLAPAPLLTSSIIGALVVGYCGSDEQRKAILPEIANGRQIVALAMTEPSATWARSGVAATARKDGDSLVLDGTKLFISDAHIADQLIVAVQYDGALRLVLVDPKSAGMSLQALTTIAGDKQFEVKLQGVRVPAANLLPGGDAEFTKALDMATVIHVAQMVGSSQKALDMTVEYAKQRVAFGRPIGSFQAIQHKCAEVVTNIDALRVMNYEAAWKLDEGMDATLDVSMVKDFANEVYLNSTVEGHLIFAGLAFTMDHDLHLYFRKTKFAEALLGDSRYHRERMAQALAL